MRNYLWNTTNTLHVDKLFVKTFDGFMLDLSYMCSVLYMDLWGSDQLYVKLEEITSSVVELRSCSSASN